MVWPFYSAYLCVVFIYIRQIIASQRLLNTELNNYIGYDTPTNVSPSVAFMVIHPGSRLNGHGLHQLIIVGYLANAAALWLFGFYYIGYCIFVSPWSRCVLRSYRSIDRNDRHSICMNALTPVFNRCPFVYFSQNHGYRRFHKSTEPKCIFPSESLLLLLLTLPCVALTGIS